MLWDHESQQVDRELELQLYSMEVSSVERYEPEFKQTVNARNMAIRVTLNPLANSNQKVIADLVINIACRKYVQGLITPKMAA